MDTEDQERSPLLIRKRPAGSLRGRLLDHPSFLSLEVVAQRICKLAARPKPAGHVPAQMPGRTGILEDVFFSSDGGSGSRTRRSAKPSPAVHAGYPFAWNNATSDEL